MTINMTLRMTYSELRNLSHRLLLDLAEAQQRSGNITIALNKFNETLLKDCIANSMVYEGIGGYGIETEDKYRDVARTKVSSNVFATYLNLRYEVTKENGFDTGWGFRIGGPKN